MLGCSDARVPIELIFNEGPNDLFVVRVAGNGLGGDVLGSLKYAVDHLGGSLKLIVVLGHSGCGAVAAAVDVFLTPANYLSLAADHALRAILDRLLIVVHASATKMQATLGPEVVRRRGYREALIEASVVLTQFQKPAALSGSGFFSIACWASVGSRSSHMIAARNRRFVAGSGRRNSESSVADA